jgi:hypothetical protein
MVSALRQILLTRKNQGRLNRLGKGMMKIACKILIEKSGGSLGDIYINVWMYGCDCRPGWDW